MIDKYETENSIYFIDRKNLRYLRRPIFEYTPHSKRLEYGKWLPLADRQDNAILITNGLSEHLRIMHADSVRGIVTTAVVRYSQFELSEVE